MTEEHEEDETINIDFSKITRWFKEKFKEEKKVSEIEKEEKTLKKEIDKEIKEDQKKLEELKKDKKILEKIEPELKEEEKEAEKIDKEKEILDRGLKQAKKKIRDIKSDVEKEEDEEVSIDFSKIKNLFKKIVSGGKKEHKDFEVSEEKSEDEEISINWGEVSKFSKKHAVVLLLLIPLFLSIFFRMYPAYLPVTDDWAESSVHNSIKNMMRGQISQQYPNLPDENKDALVNEQFLKFLEENKAQVDGQIKGTSNYFKSQLQDDKGQTYLLAIDPWFWFVEARNYITSGSFGDAVVDGKEMNMQRNGRVGREVDPGIINPVVGVIIYKIMHLFNKSTSIMAAFFLIPVLIVTLSIIPAFFIAKKFAGNLGGLFAGTIVAVNHSLLGRTPAGFSDTDPYNVFFPLFIAWMFIEACFAKDIKKRVMFAVLSGLFVGLYAKTWNGWFYTPYLVTGALLISFTFALMKMMWEKGFKNIFYSVIVFNLLVILTLLVILSSFSSELLAKIMGVGIILSAIAVLYFVISDFLNFMRGLITSKDLKNILTILVSFLATSFIFVSVLSGVQKFLNSVSGIIGFIRLKEVAIGSAWPNVLTTVAEFNVVPLSQIINGMGGKLLFYIAILGIILTIIKKNEKGKREIIYAAFLAMWFVGAAYAYTKGIRFAILMVPAFAIAFGIAIGLIYQYLTRWASKELHIDRWIVNSVVILLLALLLLSPLKTAHAIAKGEIPSMNDAWYNSLTAIKDDSEDAIISSWWDFGHWFVAVSERRVTFDGADQGRRIHWIGKSLLTNDENESVAILRMLNCGQELAANTLEEYVGDTATAIHIINKIIMQSKDKAKKTLGETGLDEEQIRTILKYTHCKDLIPQYYITSQDMIGKAGVWGHFGSWDFDRATMYQKVIKKPYPDGIKILKEDFNLSESEADKIYYEIQSEKADRWVSPWPGYLSGVAGCSVERNIARCGNGLEVDLDNYDAYLNIQEGRKHPKTIVYAAKEGLIEKTFEDGVVPYSAALIPEGEGYKSIITDPLLAKSIFTQLFFFDGHGSKHFKKFEDVTSFNGQRIIIWKVSWEEQEMNIIDELVEKTNVSNDTVIEKTNVSNGDTVTVNYIGWTDDEVVFDSSIVDWQNKNISKKSDLDGYKNKELSFTAGAGQMIPGFDKAVIDMGINKTKTIKIKPEDAYGTDPAAHPLGNQTLNFKIKVVNIE